MAQLSNLIVTGTSRFLNNVYFNSGSTFNGNININNGDLQLYGKVALQGYDSWLRINELKHFTSGIFCGSNVIRTDGEIQVGESGAYFKANSNGVVTKSITSNGTITTNGSVMIHNGALELYYSTPFIDFHYNNSSTDYTSRIIESSQGVINVNGSTFNMSNGNMTNTSVTTGTLNVSSRINGSAANAVFNNVYVKDELRSTTWAIDNITNLGSTFYVSPCIVFSSPSVYINSKSGTTVTLTITDNAITSSYVGAGYDSSGNRISWTQGSKIKLMGRINTNVLGVVNGTMARQLNATTAKTAYITLNFASASDCDGIVAGQTYSGANVAGLKLMMYEVNLSVNGTTKTRPIGIRMSSYDENKKSSIDIYNGMVDDGKPVVRMGSLDGLPAVNGENPTGYGFYAAGNAYFSGRIVSSSGKIGNWNIGTDSLYVPNTTGISSNTGKFAFWAGETNNKNGASDSNAAFRVGHTGGLVATKATISGTITAIAGAIGGFTLDSTYLQSSDQTVGLSPTASDWAFWAGGSTSATAKFRVNHAGVLYATGANISGNITATSGTIGGCSINSKGQLIVPSANISGTLNASQIRVGDFTEYHDLTSETYSRYGFSIVADGNNNPWFQITPRRDIQISPGESYNSYKCNGGGTYHIEFEVSSTVQSSTTDSYGNNTYVNINIGLYGRNTAGSSVWYIPTGCKSNSSGSVQKVSTSVTLGDDVRSFSTYIQCAGSGTFSGTLKIRNISVRRMTDEALIVNGSITADKLKVSQLSAISANLGTITGGSINIGSGKFVVDSNGNFTATNGSLTGTVNATTMRAKQKYSIYNSSFNVYEDVISWFGSSLSIGLTGGDDNGTLTMAGAYFDFLDNNITCRNGNLNITDGGNLSVAKTTSTGSLSVSNTSTFNGATTFNGTLTCKNTSTFSGASTFTGSLKAGTFTFRDYGETDNNNIAYRRPVASTASDKTRVAVLQGTSNNKIVIKAQYNSTNFTNATFTGSSSDIRLKEDIKDSSVDALSKIMKMQIREFSWKQTGLHQKLGCVADELELIDPLLTVGGGYDKDGTMNIKSIDTLLLTEYAIKGIQELSAENKKLKNRIQKLEQRIN